MNTTKRTPKLVGALVALLLLPCCGFFAPDIGFGSKGSGTRTSWGMGSRKVLVDEAGAERAGDAASVALRAAREQVQNLAARLAVERPDVVAVCEAATWLRDGTVVHDDLELLLDELARHGLLYEVASAVRAAEVVRADSHVALRHAVLVREGTDVSAATQGAYVDANAPDGWAAVEVAAPDGTVTVVATGLRETDGVGSVDELLDALAFAAGDASIACGLAVGDAPIGALLEAGFEILDEAPGHGLLLARVAAE